MRNYLLLLALAGARACTPGTNLPNAKKCCPDGTESPYYNGGVGYACCGEGLATPSEAENGVLYIDQDVPANAYFNCHQLTGITVKIGPNAASLGASSFGNSNLGGLDLREASESLTCGAYAFWQSGFATTPGKCYLGPASFQAAFTATGVGLPDPCASPPPPVAVCAHVGVGDE